MWWWRRRRCRVYASERAAGGANTSPRCIRLKGTRLPYNLPHLLLPPLLFGTYVIKQPRVYVYIYVYKYSYDVYSQSDSFNDLAWIDQSVYMYMSIRYSTRGERKGDFPTLLFNSHFSVFPFIWFKKNTSLENRS